MAEVKSCPRERCGQYEVLRIINGNRPDCIPVIIMTTVDADNPFRFKVLRQSSSLYFTSYRAMQDFCHRYGWLR